MKKAAIVTACLVACVCSMGAAGKDAKEAAEGKKTNPYVWKSKVTSVAVFKNGVGFFLRQGQTKLRDGWCLSGAIPPASFGTLVVFPHEASRTVDIVGSGAGDVVEFDGVDAPDDPAIKRTRLESCMHLKVQLSYLENKKANSAAGEVVSVGNEYVVLDAESNSFAVPLAGITKLVVLENPLRVHVASDNGKPVEETTLGMAYLRKGITWVPEYSLKLLDDNTAELTLRGTLVNEAEDLVNCDVQFVVGVPHFLHTDFLEPIAVGQVIRTIGSAVTPSQISGQISNGAVSFSNSIRSSDITNRLVPDSSDRDLQKTTGNLPKVEAEGASDYTVYERKGITLRVGEKAIVTLLTKKIKYRHGYRWHLPNDIEHNLLLENDTDSAFTTGPCLVMSNNKALSEDLLKYVPRGGTGEFPVTTAVNIAKEQNEKETNRQQRAYQITNDNFADLVSLEGELKLRNYEKKPVEIVVEMSVKGKPISASDKGDLVLNTQDLRLLERTGTITWRVTIPAGEAKTLAYAYERYVPAR